MEVRFDDDHRFRVDDVQFVSGYTKRSEAKRFFIRKERALVDRYVDLCRTFHGGTLVELGIAAGGSTALLSMLAEPRKLVAVEFSPDPVPALAEFIEGRGLTAVVRPFYGVNQADRPRVAAIMDAELSGQPLDLVIDDASHLLAESRSSFESLFPRLRPGGLFIIEDWNGKHLRADRLLTNMTNPPSALGDSPQRLIEERISQHGLPPKPLSRLLIELLLARASSGDAVDHIAVDGYWATIRRGTADLDPATFRVGDLYHDHFGLAPDE